MKRTACIVMCLMMTAGAALADDAPAAAAPVFKLPDAGKVVQAYGQYVAGRPDIADAQKQAVARRVAAAAADADQRDGVIVDSLGAIYSDFATAMDKLANEDNAQAMTLLTKLMASDDPYLAANARFFAARLLVTQEKYEQALPLVQKLVGEEKDRTLYTGQAMFLRGVCQAGLLQRTDAIDSFRGFIKADENAPERLVVGALHRIDELQQMADGTLDDVEQRMDYSRRKLGLEDSGSDTQDQQKKAVVILDELIKQAEDKEKNNSGGGGGAGAGAGGARGNAGGNAGGPAGGAARSTAPVGQARIGALQRSVHGDKDEQWGEARQRQRDEVLNAIKARYPERYRELVEQYYRALQEDGDR